MAASWTPIRRVCFFPPRLMAAGPACCRSCSMRSPSEHATCTNFVCAHPASFCRCCASAHSARSPHQLLVFSYLKAALWESSIKTSCRTCRQSPWTAELSEDRRDKAHRVQLVMLLATQAAAAPLPAAAAAACALSHQLLPLDDILWGPSSLLPALDADSAKAAAEALSRPGMVAQMTRCNGARHAAGQLATLAAEHFLVEHRPAAGAGVGCGAGGAGQLRHRGRQPDVAHHCHVEAAAVGGRRCRRRQSSGADDR